LHTCAFEQCNTSATSFIVSRSNPPGDPISISIRHSPRRRRRRADIFHNVINDLIAPAIAVLRPLNPKLQDTLASPEILRPDFSFVIFGFETARYRRIPQFPCALLDEVVRDHLGFATLAMQPKAQHDHLVARRPAYFVLRIDNLEFVLAGGPNLAVGDFGLALRFEIRRVTFRSATSCEFLSPSIQEQNK
jgi:hypothetical protein